MKNNTIDPRVLALINAGGNMMQASGPSARPISFGQVLGHGIQGGLQGYQQGINFNFQEDQMNRAKAEAEAEKNKITRDIIARQQLNEIVQQHQGRNPASISNAIMASGNPDLIPYAQQFRAGIPKVKSTIKGYDESGNPVFHNVMDTGEVSATNIRPAEKMAFQNTGQQTLGIDPFTGEQRLALQNSMAPGEQARLAQSDRQFGASHGLAQANHGLAQQNAAFSRQQAVKPQFKDGYWITPPNANNPQGSMLPTDLATAPKGSQMEKTRMSERIKTTLSEDTENLIKQATGSTFGSIRDSGAAMFGVTTDPAKANATLKLRAATLAGHMPRFEGPQSDADRAYYLEMAGDLANPSKTTEEKLMALKELKRLHNLDGQSKSQTSSDGWGDLR